MDEGGSLAGKESAIVLSRVCSFLCRRSASFISRPRKSSTLDSPPGMLRQTASFGSYALFLDVIA